MISDYRQTFDEIKASEELKQKTIDMLINYNPDVKVEKTTAGKRSDLKKKKFTMSIRKLAWAASIFVIMGFGAVFIPSWLGSDNNSGPVGSYGDVYNPINGTIGTLGYVFIGIGSAVIVALLIFLVVRKIRKNKKSDKIDKAEKTD